MTDHTCLPLLQSHHAASIFSHPQADRATYTIPHCRRPSIWYRCSSCME